MVKSRDFVNLRCWKLMNNSNVIEDFNIIQALKVLPDQMVSEVDEENVVHEEESKANSDSLHSENKLDEAKNVFVSAAMSIDYANIPPTSKFIRGENIVSCWAMRTVEGEPDACVFEWLLCIDLKGSLPRYVLNTVR